MLDINTAKLIKKAINEEYATCAFPITLEDVCRMHPIPTHTKDGGQTVLALQTGDVTILVRVAINETRGVYVCTVKAQCW